MKTTESIRNARTRRRKRGYITCTLAWPIILADSPSTLNWSQTCLSHENHLRSGYLGPGYISHTDSGTDVASFGTPNVAHHRPATGGEAGGCRSGAWACSASSPKPPPRPLGIAVTTAKRPYHRLETCRFEVWRRLVVLKPYDTLSGLQRNLEVVVNVRLFTAFSALMVGVGALHLVEANWWGSITFQMEHPLLRIMLRAPQAGSRPPFFRRATHHVLFDGAGHDVATIFG